MPKPERIVDAHREPTPAAAGSDPARAVLLEGRRGGTVAGAAR